MTRPRGPTARNISGTCPDSHASPLDSGQSELCESLQLLGMTNATLGSVPLDSSRAKSSNGLSFLWSTLPKFVHGSCLRVYSLFRFEQSVEPVDGRSSEYAFQVRP